MPTFYNCNWLSRRQTHSKNQPTIVGNELVLHLQACGLAGVAKRDLLADMRSVGGPEVDQLIWQ